MDPIRPSAYAPIDWFLALATLVMAGSAFLLVKLALVDFPFEVVTWLRILLGAATLALIPAARKPLANKRDWIHVTVLGAIWMAIPFALTAKAQESIDSALAGMLSGSVPIFTAVIAVLFFKNRPSLKIAGGVVIGFIGVVVISIPELTGNFEILGILLSLTAAACFGAAYNLTVPLQRRNSSLSVIWRAQLVAVALTTPFGVAGLPNSTPSPTGITAILLVGCLSSGIAFAAFAVLASRVGSTRSSIYVYFVPVIAMLLGFITNEPIYLVSLLGVALVIVGATLSTRADSTPNPTTKLRPNT